MKVHKISNWITLRTLPQKLVCLNEWHRWRWRDEDDIDVCTKCYIDTLLCVFGVRASTLIVKDSMCELTYCQLKVFYQNMVYFIVYCVCLRWLRKCQRKKIFASPRFSDMHWLITQTTISTLPSHPKHLGHFYN